MIKLGEVSRRLMIGLGWGAIFIYINLILNLIGNREATVSIEALLLDISGLLLIGIYFGLAQSIFYIDRIQPLTKTLIHLCGALILNFTLAYFLKWYAFEFSVILSNFIFFVSVYCFFWFSFTIYNKKLVKELNRQLKKSDT
ncbi:MAG TPA: DUF3021 domain-containing protein [Pseudogracilibacillus sp.]|nr:DUF3021 domain-containing protein [Pseudogracilibacillus sp.]